MDLSKLQLKSILESQLTVVSGVVDLDFNLPKQPKQPQEALDELDPVLVWASQWGNTDNSEIVGPNYDMRYKDASEVMLAFIPAVQSWRRFQFLRKTSVIGKYFPGM